MKKQFIMVRLTILAALLPATMITAQNQNLIAAYWPESFANHTTTAPKVNHDTKGKIVYIKAKIIRCFLKLFEDAPNVNWYIQDNLYLATFLKEEKTYRALFASGGQLLYCIKWGTEASLPDDIRLIIKENYPDYTIGTVADVYENGKKFWNVNLENSDNLVIVRVTDGTLDELHHYNTHP